MAKKTINVGVIGRGFMGRAHSNAYRQVNRFFELEREPFLKAICGRNQEKARAFAGQWGYESVESDWRRLIERKDIDLIDICVPNHTHCEIAIAAAQAGKMVLCEKPLGMNVPEARRMTEAVRAANAPNLVWFNYRRVPAVALARQMIDEGMIGRVFHYRATFLQDWTISADVPMGGDGLWRLDKDEAGSGVSGDLITHNIDTALYLNGPLESVCAMVDTFVKERALQSDPSRKKAVEIDDACTFLARFANGSTGTFEATRYARGHKARKTLEINGELGSLWWDLENLHQLHYYSHGDASLVRGWRTILVTNPEHPYMANWWVPGCIIGYEHTFIHTLADFLKGLETGEAAHPTFADALETQIAHDAVLRSAEKKAWERIPE
jgi:predicted dehydrogenase